MKTNLTRRELLKLSGLTLGTVVAGNALAPVNAAWGASRLKEMLEESSFFPGEKLAPDEMRITFMGSSYIPLYRVSNRRPTAFLWK